MDSGEYIHFTVRLPQHTEHTSSVILIFQKVALRCGEILITLLNISWRVCKECARLPVKKIENLSVFDEAMGETFTFIDSQCIYS